jgi:hypothetical protein
LLRFLSLIIFFLAGWRRNGEDSDRAGHADLSLFVQCVPIADALSVRVEIEGKLRTGTPLSINRKGFLL